MIHQYCRKGNTETQFYLILFGMDIREKIVSGMKIKSDSWIILACRLQTTCDIFFQGSCSWIKDIPLKKPWNIFPAKKVSLLNCWVFDCLKSKPDLWKFRYCPAMVLLPDFAFDEINDNSILLLYSRRYEN